MKAVNGVQKVGLEFVQKWNDFINVEEMNERYPLKHAILFAKALQKEVA